MSKETIVAKRYAKALFEVARERGKIAEVEQELQAIADALQANPDYVKLLEHPNIGASVKGTMLKQAFGASASEEVLNTLQLLVERGRESILRDLVTQYSQVANDALGQAKAKVYTPLPLTAEESDKISAAFGQITGKKIRIESFVDPSLLGGLQIRIGDRLYDGSLSGKLQRIEKSLVQA
ncbi:F0F1 ATP synthase subunit delta [Paenibacillus hemerocallicola]|uniref:ATP synthase subunit delta n=1 Tax=Paenibacillus hemerocallicola TaxID=1172614 RepID=A0A5C4T826_9BACL|nr:F0F1 ATP synthase subunit delta [Paenibacillus hemerocallicola]TNJ64710.1 F0F1 ATP synthase subunit delta [Paenibacillus hemerocallicola]